MPIGVPLRSSVLLTVVLNRHRYGTGGGAETVGPAEPAGAGEWRLRFSDEAPTSCVLRKTTTVDVRFDIWRDEGVQGGNPVAI